MLEKMRRLRKFKHYEEAAQLFLAWRAGGPGNALWEQYGAYRPTAQMYSIYLEALRRRPGATVAELRAVVDGVMAEDGVAPDAAAYSVILDLLQRAVLAQPHRSASLAPLRRVLREMHAARVNLNLHCYAHIIPAFLHTDRLDQASKYLTRMWDRFQFFESRGAPRADARLYERAHVGLVLTHTRQNDYAAALAEVELLRGRLGALSLPSLAVLLDATHTKRLSRDLGACLLAMVPDALQPQKPTHHFPILLEEGMLLKWLDYSAATADGSLARAAWRALDLCLSRADVPKPGAPLDRPCPASYHAYIHALAAAGQIEDAFKAVAALEAAYRDRPELAAPLPELNVLVEVISRSKEEVDRAFFMLDHLREAGGTVTPGMLNCVLAGCAQLRDTARLWETYEYFASAALTPNVNTFNVMMYGLGRCGQLNDAARTMDEMARAGVVPNVQSHELAVQNRLRARDLLGALAALDDMIAAGLEPPNLLTLSLLQWCDRAGDTEGRDKVMALMRRQHNAWGRAAPDTVKLICREAPFHEKLARVVTSARTGGKVSVDAPMPTP